MRKPGRGCLAVALALAILGHCLCPPAVGRALVVADPLPGAVKGMAQAADYAPNQGVSRLVARSFLKERQWTEVISGSLRKELPEAGVRHGIWSQSALARAQKE